MEFQGWYTDEALTSAYDFNLPLEDSIVLYAKWAPKIENTVDNVSPSVDSNVGKNEDTNTTNITNATNATNNPNTGDNINTYIIMFIISSIVIVVNIIIVKKFDKKMFKSK